MSYFSNIMNFNSLNRVICSTSLSFCPANSFFASNRSRSLHEMLFSRGALGSRMHKTLYFYVYEEQIEKGLPSAAHSVDMTFTSS